MLGRGVCAGQLAGGRAGAGERAAAHGARPKNEYVAHFHRLFAGNGQFRAKLKQSGADFVIVGCVESVTLKMADEHKHDAYGEDLEPRFESDEANVELEFEPQAQGI